MSRFAREQSKEKEKDGIRQTSTRPRRHLGKSKLLPRLLCIERHNHLDHLVAGQQRCRKEKARGGQRKKRATLNGGN